MGKDLNKTNCDYYSVRQDDNLPVKLFKFQKISWNSVSKEHIRVLELISYRKRSEILKPIPGV